MNIFSKILAGLGKTIARNPSTSSSVAVFGLGFLFIAGNAIYGQNTQHPSPLYGKNTEKRVASGVQHVTVKTISASPESQVLTIPESLKNVPVPTASPMRKKSGAAQSSLVREVQAALASVGMYEGKVDGIYGSATKESIIEYQQNAGILPNGEASFGLLESIRSAKAISSLQARNNNNPAQTATLEDNKQPKLLVFDKETVALIQSGLRDNFAEETISVDGLLGRQTSEAIQRFQKRFSLEVTGELNEDTLQKMVSLGIINNI